MSSRLATLGLMILKVIFYSRSTSLQNRYSYTYVGNIWEFRSSTSTFRSRSTSTDMYPFHAFNVENVAMLVTLFGDTREFQYEFSTWEIPSFLKYDGLLSNRYVFPKNNPAISLKFYLHNKLSSSYFSPIEYNFDSLVGRKLFFVSLTFCWENIKSSRNLEVYF